MATAQTAPTETKLCSSCGINPRVDQRDKSTNTQCSDCKYESQKKWAASKAQQEQAQSFAAGVSAAKELLMNQFRSRVGNAVITGFQAASLIGDCKGPFPPV